jgi:hypothetical protein
MASLYQSSGNARKIILGLLVLAVLIIAWDTINRARNITPTTPTTPRFYMNPDETVLGEASTLPEISIDSITLQSGTTPSYSRINAIPVNLPDVSYVYEIEQPRNKINTFEDAVSVGQILGFERSDLTSSESDILMNWISDDETKSLSYDRSKYIWKLDTVYEDNLEARRNKSINSNTQTYGSRVKSLISRLGFNSDGLSEGSANVRLAYLGPLGTFVQTEDPLEAEYVAIDVFRRLDFADVKPQSQQPELQRGQVRPENEDGLVYTDDPRVGQFSLIASNDLSNFSIDIFELNFTDFIFTGRKGKYFIISFEEAFTKMQRQEGSLVSLTTRDFNSFLPYPTNSVKKFTVDSSKTELGFYEPREWNGYITPIFIFYGTAEMTNGELANFIYFVDALKRN